MSRRRSTVDIPDGTLSSLSQSLSPLEDSESVAQETAKVIFEKIRDGEEKLRVVRFHLGGAAATMSTTWLLPEYLCVVFVSQEELDLDWTTSGIVSTVNEKLQSFVKQWAQLLERQGIQCEVDRERVFVVGSGGIRIRLELGLDAKQFAKDVSPSNSAEKVPSNVAFTQTLGLMELFSRLPSSGDRSKIGNTNVRFSFCELRSFWLSQQSFSAHQLIRMAKLWSSFCCPFQLDLEFKFKLLESIAVEAAKGVVAHDPFKTIGAFRKFLEMLVNHSTYKRIQIRHDNLKYFSGLRFPKIAEGSAFILDPCNPYNNLLEGETEAESESFEKFLLFCSKQAQKSVEALDAFLKNSCELADVFLADGVLELYRVTKPEYAKLHTSRDVCYFAHVLHPLAEDGKTFCDESKLVAVVACVSALVPRSASTTPQDLVSDLAELLYKHLKIRTSSLFVQNDYPELELKVPLSVLSSVQVNCGIKL